MGKPEQFVDRCAGQHLPARTGRPPVLGFEILNCIGKILIDLRQRHSFHLHAALGQIIEKRAGVQAMVRYDHRVIILRREQIREFGDQLVVQFQHAFILSWSRDRRGSQSK